MFAFSDKLDVSVDYFINKLLYNKKSFFIIHYLTSVFVIFHAHFLCEMVNEFVRKFTRNSNFKKSVNNEEISEKLLNLIA